MFRRFAPIEENMGQINKEEELLQLCLDHRIVHVPRIRFPVMDFRDPGSDHIGMPEIGH